MKLSSIGIVVGLVLAVVAVLALKAQHDEPDVQVASVTAFLPRLVDLGAGKCIPCKKMAPILEELRTNFADRLSVELIDVWENPDAAEPYKIDLIPTQIFYSPDGRELFRHQGFFGRDDILAKWKELGFDLGVVPSS